MFPVTLASELTERTLWYPTILGVLVVVAGFALFCGSIYLLLGTNLGARLGFLVAFTAFFGFMVILSALWVTTASPLNTLKGRIPEWVVKEKVEDLADSKISEARRIQQDGDVVSVTEAANVKAAVDSALVTQQGTAAHPVEPEVNEFAEFGSVTEYMVVETYEVGGSDPKFYKAEFTHTPLFAVAEYCAVTAPDPDRPFGLPPVEATCSTDADAARGFIVLERDLGSLRLPPVVVFFASLILFGLGLLNLHWREKDQMALAAAAARPVPVPVPDREPGREPTKV